MQFQQPDPLVVVHQQRNRSRQPVVLLQVEVAHRQLSLSLQPEVQ